MMKARVGVSGLCLGLVMASVSAVNAGSVDLMARATLYVECFDDKAFRSVKGWESAKKYSSGTQATATRPQWCLVYPEMWPYGQPGGAKYLEVWSSGGTEDKPRGLPIWVQVGANQRILCSSLEKLTAAAPLQTGWFARPVCK